MSIELPVLGTAGATCEGCVAHCCRYVLIEVDKPTSKSDYDQIRWLLLHENISLGIGEDSCWYIEVATRCKELDERNLCRSYLNRPDLCEKYDPEECLVWNPDPAYKHEFKTADEFLAWLDERGVDWRYKAHEKRVMPGSPARTVIRKKKRT
jgi:Fe-S-cluster containining protein